MSSSNTEVLVTMPQMGVSVAEGTLAVWHKRVGDWVERDEIICEISTDKIDTDVPSPAAGRVAELIVSENEVVPVGAPLARIATGERAVDASDAETEPGERLSDAPAGEERGSNARAGEERGSRAPAGEENQSEAPAKQEPTGEASTPEERGHGRIYSPVVQRLAAEHGVDLAALHGSGRAGRVRKQDVLAVIAGRGARGEPDGESVEPAGAPAQTGAARNGPRVTAGAQAQAARAGTPGAGGPPRAAGAPSQAAGPDYAEPLSRMRQAIAEHMTRSLRTAAHCTTIVEADFSAVEQARERLRCSPLPFVARAAVEALGEHPALNATLEGEMLTRHRDVNLGIAVSLGERGLIVPVIHRAQELSVEGLAVRIRELARRARSNELTPDEVRGGSFTITNPGGHGSIASTPIINQPQVAILDLEAVVRRAVVVTDADGREALAIRPMAFLCLSWDHRALDGALAAQFLATLRRRLEGS